MNETIKTPVYYTKATILATLLFVESFFLSKIIFDFVQNINIFSANLEFIIPAVIILIIMLITNALMSGVWDKWEQYVFTPLPVAAGMFLIVFSVSAIYALITAFLVVLLLIYDAWVATDLKNSMIKFKPRLVLRYTSKGLILSFSLLATLLLLITAGREPKIDIGEQVGVIAEKHFQPELNKQIEKAVQEGMSEKQLESLAAFGLDSRKYPVSGSSILEKIVNSGIALPEISMKETITNEVNNFLEPYKRFFNPLLAAIVFGLMQFIGSIAMMGYTLVISPTFFLAKKIGLIKVSTVQVEKEYIHF